MPTPTVPQLKVLAVASEGAVFRDAPFGGDWLYAFPGVSLMKRASGVTCRSLVKHGWLQRTHVAAEPQGIFYAISAEGRAALQNSGLKQRLSETSGPGNIRF